MRKRVSNPDTLFRFRGIEYQRRQVAEVRRTWPTLTARASGLTLEVSGLVQPTPLSEVYRIRVVYVYGDVPEAYVDEPALRPRDDGEHIPHVYEGPRPCLYLPKSGEWVRGKMIAATIIPWLLLWLTYYELWHATGEWQGGGEHPAPPEPEREEPLVNAAEVSPAVAHPPKTRI